MRIGRSILCTLLLLVAPGLRPAAAQIVPGTSHLDDWEQEKQRYTAESLKGLQELIHEWQTAVAEDDARDASRYYADNAVLHLRSDHPVEGKRAIEDGLRELLPTIGQVQMGVSDFAASGNLGYILGRFWYQLDGDGGTSSVTGTYVIVAERAHRDWRIRSQVFKPETPTS